jgi:hypothetical protein
MKLIQRAVIVALLGFMAIPAVAQYTDMQAFADLGGAQEFARRRSELAKQMKTGTALLFARLVDPEGTHYREDNDFYYYTGVGRPGCCPADRRGNWAVDALSSPSSRLARRRFMDRT